MTNSGIQSTLYFIFLAVAELFLAALIESQTVFQSIGVYRWFLSACFFGLAVWCLIEGIMAAITFRDVERQRKRLAQDDHRQSLRRLRMPTDTRRQMDYRDRVRATRREDDR